ncbi:Protein EXPORTIN 1A [Linum perenne]
MILVQILKHEWPSRWQRFIPDLVAISKGSETVCENCMTILKLLSEDVFDFSHGEMIELKVVVLKITLNSEFQIIHDMCLHGLSQRTKLIQVTLTTLHAFLSWIKLQYVFESSLVCFFLSYLFIHV